MAVLKKKHSLVYAALVRKMTEVIDSKNLDHYKNIRAPMHNLKRVHVIGPFVLTFHVKEDMVWFFRFDHHDRIYEKKR